MEPPIRCDTCGTKGPDVDPLRPREMHDAIEASGFEWHMVHSGLSPKYEWVCPGCLEFRRRIMG